jgi:hypothetical protein
MTLTLSRQDHVFTARPYIIRGDFVPDPQSSFDATAELLAHHQGY